MSRAVTGICTIFLCATNWCITKPFSSGTITAQCLKFLQKILGKILEDFGAKAIITIINPFCYSIQPLSRAALFKIRIAESQTAAS